MTKEETTEPRFKNVQEVLADPYFIGFVYKGINELRIKRAKRPKPQPGFHYKRDWYDRMNNEGHLEKNYFIDNIESIWEKRSPLSSEVRNVIRYVCDKALYQAIAKYEQEKQKTPPHDHPQS